MKQIDFDTVHRLASVGNLVEPLRRAFVSQASVRSAVSMIWELSILRAPCC